MIRRVFFDAVGTLMELAEPVGQVYACFGRAHGIKAEADDLQAAFGQVWRATPPPQHPVGSRSSDDDRSWWRTVVRATFMQAAPQPFTEKVLDLLFDDLYLHFARAAAWRLFDDVVPALDLLRMRFDLHVLSNFDRRLEGVLQGLGIAQFFQTVTLSSAAGVSKPHPRLFVQALAAAGGEAAESLHVGDEWESDVVGATTAGLHAWHVQRPGAGLHELAKKLLNQDYSCLQPPRGRVCMPPPKTARG